MNAKNKVLTALVSLSMVNWCSEYDSKARGLGAQFDSLALNQNVSQLLETANPREISPIFNITEKTNKEIYISLDTDDENSFTHTNVLESVESPKNTTLEFPISQLFKKYWNRSHPLYVSWVEKNFKALLGKWWIENLSIPQKLNHRSEEITSDTNYEIGDTLRFPLINPLLKEDFPQYLSDQLKEDWFEWFSDADAPVLSKKMLNKNNQKNANEKSDYIYDIVVKRAPSWKAALALYRDWELFMATYVSVWLNTRKTKMWQFKILGKEPYKRSRKYNNAAMPLSLHFWDGFAFHQWLVTWGNLSHGCVRIPGVYAGVLYSLIKDIEHTDVFIPKNLYNPKK